MCHQDAELEARTVLWMHHVANIGSLEAKVLVVRAEN